MIEQPECSFDDTIVILNADQKEYSMSEISKTIDCIGYLYERIKNDDLKVKMRFNCVSLAFSHLKNIAKKLGYEEDLELDRDNDCKIIRGLNEEIAELKKKMTESVCLEGFSGRLKQMHELVYCFWRDLGFTYCKGEFLNHGPLLCDMSCMIETYPATFSEKPVSDKEQLQENIDRMKEEGVELFYVSQDREIILLDNPNNRQWVSNKISHEFPKAKIQSFESYNIHGHESLHRLWRIKVLIPMETLIEKLDA